MSLNKKRVLAYISAKIEHYKSFYPDVISKGIETSVSYGSFGACLITIKGGLWDMSDKYVSNYSAIDDKISDFFTSSQRVLEQQAYNREQEDNKKGMSGTLRIYADGELVNTIEFKEAYAIKNEILKILMADKKRGVKTTYKPLPYSNDIEIIQKWEKSETLHQKYKYINNFKNIEY